MNLIELLQSVPELASLPYADLERLDRAMTVGEFPDEHEFVREGEKANDVFLLMEGEVSVTHRQGRSGETVEIKRMHPGELFGLIALIDHGRRAASCKAIGPVRIASLPYSAFSLLYHSTGQLSHAFLDIVVRQLTRDFRQLTGVVRRAMFASDASETDEIARHLVTTYGVAAGGRESDTYFGPERRMRKRRKTD